MRDPVPSFGWSRPGDSAPWQPWNLRGYAVPMETSMASTRVLSVIRAAAVDAPSVLTPVGVSMKPLTRL